MIDIRQSKETDVEGIRALFFELAELMRRRPDIGVVLYKNLAKELVRKLRSLNAEIAFLNNKEIGKK